MYDVITMAAKRMPWKFLQTLLGVHNDTTTETETCYKLTAKIKCIGEIQGDSHNQTTSIFNLIVDSKTFSAV